MASLPPIKQEFLADISHFTETLDIIVRHLSALRDDLRAHGGESMADEESAPERRTAVIAGNWHQFRDWCHAQGISVHSPNVFYATPDAVRGRRNVAVVRTGSWESRDDLAKIEMALRFVNLNA